MASSFISSHPPILPSFPPLHPPSSFFSFLPLLPLLLLLHFLMLFLMYGLYIKDTSRLFLSEERVPLSQPGICFGQRLQ